MNVKKVLSVLCFCALLSAQMFATGKKDGAADAKGLSGQIEFFSQKPECVTVMNEIIADFMAENPGVKVVQTSTADPWTVIQTRVITNEIPDVLNVFPAEDKYKLMFDDELMVDLTDEPFMKNVSDKMLGMAAYKGRQYALPMTLSSYGIYYRTDIFEQHGIKEPKTYAELIEVCKKLKAAGLDAIAMPNKDVGNIAQRLERLVGVINPQSNEEFKKIAAGQMKVEDSKTIRAFGEMCVELQKYATKDSLGLGYESAVADLVNGKAGMMISGTWMLSTMKAANPNIKVKLIPFPSPLGGEQMVPVNIDTSFAVSTDTKNQAAARAFVAYMARTEVAQKYYSVDGNVNMIKGVKFDKSEHQYVKDLMDNGKMFLTQVNFWPNGLREEMRPAAQQLFVDNNVDNFVKAFGNAINKLYKK